MGENGGNNLCNVLGSLFQLNPFYFYSQIPKFYGQHPGYWNPYLGGYGGGYGSGYGGGYGSGYVSGYGRPHY